MIERKYLAHLIDAAFSESTPSYVRLGKDLEEFNDALNPQVDAKMNILGENSVHVTGYAPQSDVAPFYFEDYNDALSKKIMELANTRAIGDSLKTTVVDALLKPGATATADPTIEWAYKETAYVVPQSVGGNTQGVQTPFQIYRAGDRVRVNLEIEKGSTGKTYKVTTYTAPSASE